MEALSTPVSSLSLPELRQCHRLKPPPPLLLHHPHISTSTAAATATATASAKTPKPTPSSHKFTPLQLSYVSRSPPTPSPIHTHRNAATGYAAALMDAALCSKSVDAVHKDVKRLSKWLQQKEVLKDIMRDPSVEESVKGRVIREVSEKAKFRRQVMAMVKMLVAKNKSGMVAQVMEEFQRIYLDLNSSLRVAT